MQRGFFEFTSDYNLDVSVTDTVVGSGSIPAGAYQAYVTNKDGHRFKVNIATAPGTSNSVTISYKPWK